MGRAAIQNVWSTQPKGRKGWERDGTEEEVERGRTDQELGLYPEGRKESQDLFEGIAEQMCI